MHVEVEINDFVVFGEVALAMIRGRMTNILPMLETWYMGLDTGKWVIWSLV